MCSQEVTPLKYIKGSNTMNEQRKQIETELINKALELYRMYKEYNPNGDYLSISFLNGYVNMFNEHWENDKDRIIDCFYDDSKGITHRECLILDDDDIC